VDAKYAHHQPHAQHVTMDFISSQVINVRLVQPGAVYVQEQAALLVHFSMLNQTETLASVRLDILVLIVQ
jgi:hypothetical protein